MIAIPKRRSEEIRIERKEEPTPGVDVRVWYTHTDGKMRPTQKGVRIRLDQAADVAQAILNEAINDVG